MPGPGLALVNRADSGSANSVIKNANAVKGLTGLQPGVDKGVRPSERASIF